MSDNDSIRFEWRGTNDLPFSRIAVFTAVIFYTCWKLIRGRFLVLSPSLMKYEFLRFLTLLRYPRENKPDLIRIAAAGFYHDGNADNIICYMCGLTIYGITRNHDPLQLHVEKSNNCDFLRLNRDNNRRCFKGTDSENSVFHNVVNEEEITLESLNNIPVSSINIFNEHEQEEGAETAAGSSRDSSLSLEDGLDYVSQDSDLLSLPSPEGFPLLIQEEYNRETVNRDYDIESDLNVSLNDEARRRRMNTYNFQTGNAHTTASEMNDNDRNESEFDSAYNGDRYEFQTEHRGEQADTHVEVSESNFPSTRDEQNEQAYNFNVPANNSHVSFNSVNDNEQDAMNSAGNIHSNGQPFSPFWMYSQPFNMGYNSYTATFNGLSSVMMGSALQEILRRQYQVAQQENYTAFSNLPNQYSSYVQRLQSFLNWPKERVIKAKDLAAAGFLYTGNGDCVRCFQCRLELAQWQSGDDPWLEHAKHRNTCIYVEQMLGSKFLRAIRENNDEEIEKYTACLESTSCPDEGVLSVRNDSLEGAACNGRKRKKETDTVKAGTLCKVCQENVSCFAIIPCGDLVCGICANTFIRCPICQQDVQGRLRVKF